MKQKMAIVWRKVTFFSTFRHTIATFSKKHSQDVKDFRQW